MKDSVIQTQFGKLFGREPRIFSAPGRVNLIGEHTDYNDGFVLPMAIDRRTIVAAAIRVDRLIRCVSTGYDGRIQFAMSADLRPADDWANHIRGMAACLIRDGIRDGFELRGADLLIASDIPVGAGLSSSAALEISVGFALLKLADQPIDLVALSLTAQRAEHQFTGTKCGIMDQYIACLGAEDHALFIDCRSLGYREVPIKLSDARVVVCNTMVKHDLSAGEYNQRRAECEEAVRLLSNYLPDIRALRDAGIDEFNRFADSLPEVVRRRARHVIAENARTLAAVEALERGDLAEFGRLMYASHRSLREDYEVSCRELDLMVEIASSCPGVIGARMTGGGFGGCTVNLVETRQIENFISTITENYQNETSIGPACYVCTAAGGVMEEERPRHE